MPQTSAEIARAGEQNPGQKLFASRIPELDGIRGVAILLVVGSHYLIFPEQGGWLTKLASATAATGWSGVDLFFVLSGFLIGGILMDNCDSPNYFKTFYIRRVCRILPLYYLWVGLYLVLGAFLPATFPGYGAAMGWEIPHFPKWGYFLFLQNFYMAAYGDFGALWMAATWSLATEEQFYLLAPALIRVILPRKPLPVLIALIALVPLLRIFLFLFHSTIFIYVLSPCRMDALLLGVLCAYLVRQKSIFAWLAQSTKMLYALFFFLLAGMGYIVLLGYGRALREVFQSFEMASFGYTWVALFYASVLLIAVTNKASVVARVLRNPLLRHFGIIAYGMFIMHLAVNGFFQGLFFGAIAADAPSLLRTFAAVPAFLITWGLAVLSWRWFERPLVDLGHNFKYKRRGAGEEQQPSVVAQPL